MKRLFLLILVTAASIAGYSQVPSQIQAKRGVFTERLYLTGSWIDRITPNMFSDDSTNDNVVPTAKAVADYMRQITYPNFADTNLIFTGDRTHNGAGYNLSLENFGGFKFGATGSAALDFNLYNLPLSFDFANNFPVTADNAGKLYRMSRWPGNFATEDLTFTGSHMHNLGANEMDLVGSDFYKSRSIFHSGNIIFSVYDNDLAESTDYSKLTIKRLNTTLDSRSTYSKTQSTIDNTPQNISLKSASLATPRYSEIGLDSNHITFEQTDGNYQWKKLKPAIDTVNFKPLVVDSNGNTYKMSGWPVTGGSASSGVRYVQTSPIRATGTLLESGLVASGTGTTIIPASAWAPGKSYKVTMYGTYSVGQIVNTFTLRLKIGNTTLATTTSSLSSKDSGTFNAQIVLTCRTTGSSGTVTAFGNFVKNTSITAWSNGVSALGTANAATFDMTANQILNVTAQFSDASEGTSLTAYLITLEEIK